MSKRETNLYHFTIRAGVYLTCDDAIKEANAIKRFILRACEQHNYSCVILMGISQRNKSKGHIEFDPYGKRIFIPNSRTKGVFVDPHIHMFVLANPGDALIGLLKEYINKKHPNYRTENNQSPVRSVKCYDYPGIVPYILEQSEYIRTLFCNPMVFDQDLVDEICGLFENYHLSMGGKVPLFQKLYEYLADARKQKTELLTPDTPFTFLEENIPSETLPTTRVDTSFNDSSKPSYTTAINLDNTGITSSTNITGKSNNPIKYIP